MSKKIYEPLSSIYLPDQKPDQKLPKAKDFFQPRLPASDRKDADLEFVKVFVLEKQRQKNKNIKPKKTKPRVSTKYLTARERRQRGLYRLPKVGLKYANFTELHSMWTTYMHELLDVASPSVSQWTPGNMEDATYQNIQRKVCRADFHGAIIKVKSAGCPSHIGVEGICLLESKYTLQLISKDNKLRMIPKRGSTFSLEVGGYRFTLPGNSIEARPADRATRKLKNKPPLDF